MKNIAIDITHYERISGYWVVTRNIVKWIIEKNDGNFYYLFSNEDKNLNSLKEFKNFVFINTHEWFTKYKFFSLPKYLKKYNIDIFLSLDQTLPFKKVCKYIVIEHDIWFQRLWKKWLLKWLLNGSFKKSWVLYYLLNIEKIHLKNADIIVTPSEFTKNELIDFYEIDENKIKVIYWWIDHLIKNSIKYSKKDFILFPFCNDHNNGFVYKLAQRIISKNITKKVIILKWNQKISTVDWIEIIQTYISNKDLEQYYKEALITIYYSYYDWFWFIPLESMFYSTPVIVNNSSSLPEISGKWAIIINSMDIDIWISKIEEIIKIDSLYNKMIIAWKIQVEKYNWLNTIEQILSLLG